jgi:hypothetical protein
MAFGVRSDFHDRSALILRMKLSLLGFDAPDKSLDPFEHEFIAYAPCDLTVVIDLRIEFFALLAHGSFPIIMRQRAIIECAPPWRAKAAGAGCQLLALLVIGCVLATTHSCLRKLVHF